MNEVFKRLPELTEMQINTINSLFTAYIFYKKEKRSKYNAMGVPYTSETYHCVCTNCNNTYDHEFEDAPKHNSIVKCPKCNHSAILKHTSYGKKNLREQIKIVVFCPEHNDAVWMRAFYATKTYNGDPNGYRMLNSLYTKEEEELTPEVDLSETARYLLEPGLVRCFKFDYSYYGTHSWKETHIREPFTSYMGSSNRYTIISENLLDNTFLRYIDINAWYNAALDQYHIKPWSWYGEINLKPVKYICNFAKFPIIESVMKAGFSEFVSAKILTASHNKRLLNWEATKLTYFFKTLSKSEIRMLKDEEYKVTFLQTYSLMKRVNSKADAVECRNNLKEYGADTFCMLLKMCLKYSLNYTKAINYIKKRKNKYKNSAIQLWKDYLDMASRLSYDMKNDVVLYPKALQKSHDEASKIIALIIREEQAEKMKDITIRLKNKYSFEFGELAIVVPETMQEIIDEGKALEHCVGGYAERHAAGRLAILFVRYKSSLDKPLATMEVHGTNIHQVHGFRNDREKPLPSAVKEFVAEFKNYITNPALYKKTKLKERKSA